jgi:hypothetical protein
MLAGQPAFTGDNLGVLLNAILRGTPVPVSEQRPEVPPAVDAVIARAMQKNPQARYQDAAEMARDLAQCRALLGRRPGAPASAPSDPYAATVVGDATQFMDRGPDGLGLSPLFDSTAGFQRLLHAQPDDAPPPAPKVRLGWLAWAAAYLLAGIGAVAIALR